MGSLGELVVRFTKELEELVGDPARIERLGKEAAGYALSEYAWSRKAERTKEVYDWVLGGMKGAKPVFW